MKKVFMFLMLSTPLWAADLGTYGALFPIEEESLLELLQRRLKEIQKSGQVEKFQQEAQKRVKERVMHPKPVEGLKKAMKRRSFVHDPSIVLNQDMRDQEGRIFAHKWQYFNPLDYGSWGVPLVLFDGDDPTQLAFVKAHYQEAKWVLTRGSPLELSQKEKKPVFFDQAGKIVERFHIQAVPAVIYQDKKVLRVEEIPMEESPMEAIPLGEKP